MLNEKAVPFKALPVFGPDLEVRLRMIADRAFLGSFRAFEDRPAVAAFPEYLSVLQKDMPLFEVFREFFLSLFVFCLHLGDVSEHFRKFPEALFLGLFCHPRVHVVPLVIFAFSSLH